MSEGIITIFVTTCFLIASKYDEIDDKLVFIEDVQKYYMTTKFKTQIPKYADIVETERRLMQFYDWDLGF